MSFVKSKCPICRNTEKHWLHNKDYVMVDILPDGERKSKPTGRGTRVKGLFCQSVAT